MLTPEQISKVRAEIGMPDTSSENVGAANVARRRQLASQYDSEQEQAKNKQKNNDAPGILNRIGTDLNNRLVEGGKTIEDSMNGKINPLTTGLQFAGKVGAGSVLDVINEIFKSGINAVPTSVKQPVGHIIDKTAEWLTSNPRILAGLNAVNNGIDAYQEWAKSNPEDSKTLESVVNIAQLIPAYKGAESAATAAGDAGKIVTKAIDDTSKGLSSVVDKIPQYADKATKMLASEPNAQVKTILQETPKPKFDEYLKIAQESSVDPRKPSVFEKVGDKLADATKQLKKQNSSIGAQKSAIIEKAKTGLQEFTEAPRKAVLKVMQMEDNPMKEKVINKLKSIKTKIDADRTIDEIQSMIYDAKGTNLIAEGSSAEKQLKGIIGEMNDALKNSLPPSYRSLNAKFAERTKIISTLNRALGEVVDGVATRGSSLIKQFFSPSASKTKELFDFIKKSTGIDLAQDATVAKFMGELFNDPKVRSLLEGLPTSRQGVVNKTVDFIVEKSGLGKKVQEKIRKGTLQKARGLTK